MLTVLNRNGQRLLRTNEHDCIYTPILCSTVFQVTLSQILSMCLKMFHTFKQKGIIVLLY